MLGKTEGEEKGTTEDEMVGWHQGLYPFCNILSQDVAPKSVTLTIFYFKFLVIYLLVSFLTALSFRCCAQAFSSCSMWEITTSHSTLWFQ